MSRVITSSGPKVDTDGIKAAQVIDYFSRMQFTHSGVEFLLEGVMDANRYSVNGDFTCVQVAHVIDTEYRELRTNTVR